MGWDRLRALMILSECTGDDIWSPEHCRARGIPESWMDELTDCFESGFKTDDQTIYLGNQVTNQYNGVRDVDLAIKIGEYLGIDAGSLRASAANRAALVRAIREAVEDD